MNVNNSSYSIEVSEEEYNNSNGNSLFTTVESNYKKMTTNIYKSGSRYKYEVLLHWKNIPSTRSYDIIALAHESNVYVDGNTDFEQDYELGNLCYFSTTYIGINSSTGRSAIFKLPTGNISSLDQRFSYYVKKYFTGTITSQSAVGDYAHATSSITQTNAMNHTVNNMSGIVLSSSISDYYDSITASVAHWSGRW